MSCSHFYQQLWRSHCVSASCTAFCGTAPVSPTSPIHRRRGAIVELPNEWYAKAEAYDVLGVVRTRSRANRSTHKKVVSQMVLKSFPRTCANQLSRTRRTRNGQQKPCFHLLRRLYHLLHNTFLTPSPTVYCRWIQASFRSRIV